MTSNAQAPQAAGNSLPQWESVEALLRERRPEKPIYCVYPDTYRRTARDFVDGFPGRVLYAVKANDHPSVIDCLHQGGVTHFDCASVPEIALVRARCQDATPYFMIPARLRGAAREAERDYGVRHFMIDHSSGLAPLAEEIDMPGAVVFARMAVHHDAAMQDLSTKFGAPPADIPELLEKIGNAGAEPALAFNVGSAVIDPAAYRYAIDIAAEVLTSLSFRIRLVDIGGGLPKSYPGFKVPPLDDYFATFSDAAAALTLADDGELLVEPGRALAGPGLSALTEVLLRKDRRLYLNDGMYGIFWELRFKGHDRYPVRCFRDGRPYAADAVEFRLFGPTCDATDAMPGAVALPEDIRPGDYLEFGCIGAYSLSGRTRFNGHFSDDIVEITGPGQAPPE